MHKIKLILIDVDGIMTDGTKIYNEDHEGIYKKFCDLDFTAIRRLMASDVNVCLVSGDLFNKKMADKRNIPFIYSRTKQDEIPEIQKKYNVDYNNMAFVGDDMFDYEIMMCCNYRFCPKNSPNDLQKICTKIIDRHSGDGVIARLYDMLVLMKLINPAEIKNIGSWHS